MAISTCLSITALNMNGLNVPIKRHRMSDWIKKQEPIIFCLQETQCRGKTHKDLKTKGMKKIFHANEIDKKAKAVILIVDKINFNTMTIKKKKRDIVEW